MIFKRISYIDHDGAEVHEWRSTEYEAQSRCCELVSAGMQSVHFDIVTIPIGDCIALRAWLNNNPNSPNKKQYEADGSVSRTYMALTQEQQRVADEKAWGTGVPKPDQTEQNRKLRALLGDMPAAGATPAAPNVATTCSALDVQIGGDHYKKMKIQPMEYSMANKLDPCQATIIKYVSRFRDKDGIKDLEKAKHTIDLLIQFERAKEAT